MDIKPSNSYEILSASGPGPGAGDNGMRERIRSYAWARTQLGPIESWSPQMVTAVDLCLRSRLCSCIYWGEDAVILYNDAYGSILGKKDPWALGRTVSEVWPEIIGVIGPLMERTLATGETTGGDDVAIFLDRLGYVEEFYCSFSYSPIINADGRIEAVFATLPETSQRVIGERRLRTLQKLGADLREARHPEETLEIAAAVFAQNARDVPFASLYLWREDDASAKLIAAANIQRDTFLSPKQIHFDERDRWASLVAVACAEGHALAPLAKHDAPVPIGAWTVPAKEILALAFIPYQDSAPRGLLLAGINPHKAFDAEHESFFRLVADQVTRSLASAFTHEQEEERLRELQHRARYAQEAERLRIARDLHDTLLQSIQGLRFLLEAGIERDDGGDETARELFGNALKAADQAINEGREVLSLLRSTGNRSDSFSSALAAMCTEITAGTPITFDVELHGSDREFRQDVISELLGICREAVTNVVQHSQASRLSIVIHFHDPVTIRIADDGRGIEECLLSEGRAGHYGLTGMRERAASIGAHLDIDVPPQGGTAVTLSLGQRFAFESTVTGRSRD
ncbi:MAG: histidine kinase [Gammaproteobacteria bacterium]